MVNLLRGLENAKNGNARRSKKRERHAHKKRNNPSDQGGALLKKVMLILSVRSHATLPEREQRNFVNNGTFSTRLPGGHVEKFRSPKRFL